MSGPVAAILPGGRLHLQHGPIDLVIGVDGDRALAFRAARARFQTVLTELVSELAELRRPVAAMPRGRIARRMHAATRPHAGDVFVTPMAAVAGAVADEVLATMRAVSGLRRAYVNNGGDIALWLAPGESYTAAMAGLDGQAQGLARISAGDGIGGVATSGRGGRSLSLGIADSVTVLARSAAEADAAATLIANAVDLPGHAGITRAPASACDPDSDLGARLVVVGCAGLAPDEIRTALDRGRQVAQDMRTGGLIVGASIRLQGETAILETRPKELCHA